MDSCPSCKRAFADIREYPLVTVVSTTFTAPEDVPTMVESTLDRWSSHENLAKEPGKGTPVPADVLAYFRGHPGEEALLHTDGLIYHIPAARTRGFREEQPHYQPSKNNPGPELWYRVRNLAPGLRALLAEDQGLQAYRDMVNSSVGRTVAPATLYPHWERIAPWAGQPANPHYDRLSLEFAENDEQDQFIPGFLELVICGPRLELLPTTYQSPLVPFGEITYEPRLVKAP